MDLGLGGVSLELLRVLPPGSPVEGTIHDPGFEVRFSGAVVWAKPGDPHMGLRGRMGIRFTSLAAPANAPPWLAPEADSRAGGP